MRPLTVIVGPNGAGKTSVLEVLSILSSSCRSQLSSRLSELGGVADLVTRDTLGPIELVVHSPVQHANPLEYTLRIEVRGHGYSISREVLSQDRGHPMPFKHIDVSAGNVRYYDPRASGLVRPDWEMDYAESALAQVPRMYKEPEEFRRLLANTAFYGALDVSPKAPIRLPQQMRPAGLPGVRGEDLVNCLFSMREEDPDRFSMVEDALAAGFPDFERLAFPPAAAGVLSMSWKERQYSRPLYMHQLSEGTLRFLWLAALLSSRDLPPLVLLDEPEVSLHPELLRLLVGLMREASERSQMIVCTHSDRLVRFLEPSELLLAQSADGAVRFDWANRLGLDEWLADYTLDELWRTGQLESAS